MKMGYIQEFKLNDYVFDLADQKIKNIIESKLKQRIKDLQPKVIDNKRYYLSSEVDKVKISIINDITFFVSQNIVKKDIKIDQISFNPGFYREKYYDTVTIEKYLNSLLSNYEL